MPSIEPPTLAQPPAELTAPCNRPVRLPKGRDFTQAETEAHWGRDRRNLVDCSKRHDLVTTFYRERDAGLTKSR